MAHVIEGGAYAPLRGPGQCPECGWFLREGTCPECGWIAPAACCAASWEERRLYGHRQWHRWLAGEDVYVGSPWRRDYREKMGRGRRDDGRRVASMLMRLCHRITRRGECVHERYVEAEEAGK